MTTKKKKKRRREIEKKKLFTQYIVITMIVTYEFPWKIPKQWRGSELD